MPGASIPELVWVTRTSPYCADTAQKLTFLGLRALALPVLQVTSVDWRRAHETPDAIAFTSAHGARLHHVHDDWRHLPVFTVGDHTARIASSRGYTFIRSASGNLQDLKHLVVQSLPRNSTVIVIGAKEPAGDLRSFLVGSGLRCANCVVYETRPSSDRELNLATGLLSRIGGITAYSPKGASRLSEIIDQYDWNGNIYCISSACAERFAAGPGRSIHVSDHPHDEALTGMIERYWRSQELRALPARRVLPFPTRLANDNTDMGRRDFVDDDDPPPAA